MNINLDGSILGEVLDADYLVPKVGVAFVEPVNLKPTNYCTAMWNGIRCDGTHDQDWHSVSGENGRHSIWRDGYGGIILQDRPYIEELDIDLSWSDLDSIHADAREKRAHADARSIDYVGQLAGIGISGLLDTDSRAWLGTYLA